MKRKILILIPISLFFITSITIACQCWREENPKSALENFDAVFTGKVIQIDKLENFNYAVIIQTNRIFKGDLNETVIVNTSQSGFSCGYNFEKDEEYLVYARKISNITFKPSKELFVDLCSVEKISNATDDLNILENIEKQKHLTTQ